MISMSWSDYAPKGLRQSLLLSNAMLVYDAKGPDPLI